MLLYMLGKMDSNFLQKGNKHLALSPPSCHGSLQFPGAEKDMNPEEKYSYEEKKLSFPDRMALLTGRKRPVLFSEIAEFF